MKAKLYLMLFFVVLTVLFVPCTYLANGLSSTPQTFSNGSSPYGVSYQDWMIKWWQWNMAIPKDQNPESNANLAKCHVGESG